MKRIIITGGSGLIGRALAENLIAGGYEVIILSRHPEQQSGFPPGVQMVQWDGKTPAGWSQWMDGAYAVINLAGSSIAGEGFFPARWTEARRRLIVESRVQAGQAVTEAIKLAANKPAVLIQASAIGYYGPHGDETLTEETAPGTDFLAGVTARWEAATAAVEAPGVRRAVIRTGVVLTLDGGALPRLALPFKLFAGGPMGNGRQWVSWIHLRDEIRAIRFLIENEAAQGAFNLTAPAPVRNRELARAIGQIMKRPWFFPVPGFMMRLLFGEVATVVLDGQRVLPEKLVALGFDFEYETVESALRNLFGK